MARVNKERPVGTFQALLELNKLPLVFEAPSGEEFTLEFYMPTVAEVWEMLHKLPPDPKPPVKEFAPWEDGVKKVYDFLNDEYQEKQQEWGRELTNRRVLLCWGNNLPGDTDEEKIASIEQLPALVSAALRQGSRMAIELAEDAVTKRSFRTD